MSDPVEQGEQEARTYAADYLRLLTPSANPKTANLARAFLALCERVRLLEQELDEWKLEAERRGLPKELMQRLHRAEQREKGLRKVWDAYDLALRDGRHEDAAVFYEQGKELRALAASPPDEASDGWIGSDVAPGDGLYRDR